MSRGRRRQVKGAPFLASGRFRLALAVAFAALAGAGALGESSGRSAANDQEGPAEAPIARLVVAGPSEPVFSSAVDGCAAWDIPDTPARAWRDADDAVHLVSGAERSRADVGPDLGQLRRDCAVLFEGRHADDPGAYDDRAWVHATWALDDGATVLGLAHVEYHGHERPWLCPGPYQACWRNAIVEIVSTDGGRSFRRTGPAAVLPYRYEVTNGASSGRRSGYFNPSNIVRHDDHLYAFIFAEASGAQRRGACLIRRLVPASAEAAIEGAGDAWRGWNGTDFSVRFDDPYAGPEVDPSSHVCAPVSTPDGPMASTLSGLVASGDGAHWVAVTAATHPDTNGTGRTGIWAMTSRDLLRWSRPYLLFEAPLLWRRDCARPAAYAYPALIDARSTARNFDTIGDADSDSLWLYLVEMPLAADDEGCRAGPDRSLVRLPLRWAEMAGW